MDNAEIKRQLSYWEAVQKENNKTIKNLTDQNKQVASTIKFLRGLLGKDEPEVVATTLAYVGKVNQDVRFDGESDEDFRFRVENSQ